MTAYQPNIPTGTVKLNQDYLNIRNNFSQLETTYGIDHVPLTEPTQNGFHKAVHMVQQVAPAAVAGVGSIYCTTENDSVDTDQVLYYKTGLNKIIQLTRNFVPAASNVGRTFLPGGLILQWGFNDFSGQTSTAVLFTDLGSTAFPSNCFNMVTSFRGPSTQSALVLNITNLTNTGFTYYNTSSNTRSFFWIAIGN